MYQQFVLGVPFGDKPLSDTGLVAFFFVMVLVILLFWLLRLKTEINTNGIKMRYFLFLTKKLSWKEIHSLELIRYGFVGYGIRYGSKYGVIYNTKGDKGLWVQLKNGKKFVIGTQKVDELKRLIKSQGILKLID